MIGGGGLLTQIEADVLIAMRKSFISTTPISIAPGADFTRDLVGADMKEKFLLDIWRGMLRLSKIRLQTRARQVIVLVRLCVDGAPHTNPDGSRISGTHLHVYREGCDDKWAYPLDENRFASTKDMQRVFEDFCGYCNIQEIPQFQAGFI